MIITGATPAIDPGEAGRGTGARVVSRTGIVARTTDVVARTVIPDRVVDTGGTTAEILEDSAATVATTDLGTVAGGQTAVVKTIGDHVGGSRTRVAMIGAGRTAHEMVLGPSETAVMMIVVEAAAAPVAETVAHRLATGGAVTIAAALATRAHVVMTTGTAALATIGDVATIVGTAVPATIADRATEDVGRTRILVVVGTVSVAIISTIGRGSVIPRVAERESARTRAVETTGRVMIAGTGAVTTAVMTADVRDRITEAVLHVAADSSTIGGGRAVMMIATVRRSMPQRRSTSLRPATSRRFPRVFRRMNWMWRRCALSIHCPDRIVTSSPVTW